MYDTMERRCDTTLNSLLVLGQNTFNTFRAIMKFTYSALTLDSGVSTNSTYIESSTHLPLQRKAIDHRAAV